MDKRKQGEADVKQQISTKINFCDGRWQGKWWITSINQNFSVMIAETSAEIK